MNTYLLFPVFAGVLIGLTESLNKSITEKKFSVFSYSFLQWFGNLILCSILFFIKKEAFPSNPMAYIHLFIVLTTAFVGNTLLIKAYKTEDVSNINIVLRISLVISFLTGVILLSEKVTSLNYLGIILIISGIITIFYKGKRIKLSEGFIFTLIGGTCLGFITFLNKTSLNYFTPISFLVAANIGGSIYSLLFPKAVKDIIPIFKKYTLKYIFSRIASFIGYYLFLLALPFINVSVANTNYETFSLLSVVFLGIIFLKEKADLRNKIAGSTLCILGIIFLNFF